MPWTNMDISINGEKINAMAKVIWEKGTGTIELPFDESKKLDDKITIDGKDFTVRNIVSRHNEITLLDIIHDKDIPLATTAAQSLENFTSSKSLKAPFERTISRLYDLTSREYNL